MRTFLMALCSDHSVVSPEEMSDIVFVPCPKCGKVHKVSLREAQEKPRLTVDCGAVIGSAGVLKRAEKMHKRIREFQGTLHKLD